MVAGEVSGDLLGSDLIPRLREAFPDAEFEGIGGEKMLSCGFKSLFAMERLSVMGFLDPLKRLPELLHIRKTLFRHFLEREFDLVLGIDSPDFNLGLELRLRRQGLLTAHYVSPSVWAWRQGRVKKIARAVDRMLALLPFEANFYEEHSVPVSFVGHPLADQIPETVDAAAAREEFGLKSGPVLAIMPGSRAGEIDQMCRLYLQAVTELVREIRGLEVLIPAASPQCHGQIALILRDYQQLPVRLIEGRSQSVMSAADAVMLTSGTAALEAMLLKKPMVVAYRMGSLSYGLVSRLVKTPYISLPNLIARKMLVPELIQRDANVDNLVRETRELLLNRARRESMIEEFSRHHGLLRRNSGSSAADILAAMIRERHAS